MQIVLFDERVSASVSLNVLFRQELKEEYLVISSNSSSSAAFSDKRKSAEIFSVLRSGSKFYTAGISCSKHTNNELDTTVTPESPLHTSRVFLDTVDSRYGNLHTASHRGSCSICLQSNHIGKLQNLYQHWWGVILVCPVKSISAENECSPVVWTLYIWTWSCNCSTNLSCAFKQINKQQYNNNNFHQTSNAFAFFFNFWLTSVEEKIIWCVTTQVLFWSWLWTYIFRKKIIYSHIYMWKQIVSPLLSLVNISSPNQSFLNQWGYPIGVYQGKSQFLLIS